MRTGWGALAPCAVLLLAACSSGGPPPPARTPAPRASSPSTGPAPAGPTGSGEDDARALRRARAAAQARLDRQVRSATAALSREQQVAQLFVAGVPLADLAAGTGVLARTPVGGVFLAGRSRAAAADLAAATAAWQAGPGPRPWVAVDQEGGTVQSLQGDDFGVLPSALAQGRMPEPSLAALAQGAGAALRSAGVTLDLAPVVDVVPAGTERGNAPIGAFDRQYGSTAADVAVRAGAVVDGLSRSGVTATLKHFPGLGRVRGNTDTTVGVIDTTTAADSDQVAVFGRLASSPASPFVMVSSATYSAIDPASPAAFSPVVLRDLLRGRLGFSGVVLSDDLGRARAVSDVPPGERATRFLAAGGTLLLTVDASLVPEMVGAVLARDATDPAFSADVDAAVRTALRAKARAGLLAAPR